MKILVFFIVILVFAACSNQKDKPTSDLNWYGESFEIPTENDEKLNNVFEDTNETLLVLTAQIQQVCKIKGCWMNIKTRDGQELRVTFKNYGFFVPKEGIHGKKATIKGIYKKKEISIEDLRHYAMDAGKSEEEIAMITKPKLEYSMEATGLAIEK